MKLKLTTASMTEPAIPSPSYNQVDRKAPDELELHLIEGDPLSLGFSIFNGDFDDIIFSRVPK